MLTWKTSGLLKLIQVTRENNQHVRGFLSTVSIKLLSEAVIHFHMPTWSLMRALHLKFFQEKSCAQARKRPLSHFGSSCSHPKMHPAAWRNNQTLWILKLLKTQTELEKQSRKLSSPQCWRRQGRSTQFPSDLEDARTEGNEPIGFPLSLISSTTHFVNAVSTQNFITHHRTDMEHATLCTVHMHICI